jgi:hypothetical protein
MKAKDLYDNLGKNLRRNLEAMPVSGAVRVGGAWKELSAANKPRLLPSRKFSWTSTLALVRRACPPELVCE